MSYVVAVRCALPAAPTPIENSPPALARVPPKSPEEALACFDVADGVRIELVAAEPLVVDPVAMAFDERGRLYVVEMCDYSEQDRERLGKVRLLSDRDGDGRYETSRVFADNLSWPTAIACYDGGVFVGAAPDVLYCKDNDGDGVADVRNVVFTGFGRGNVQGLLNSFQWGLDHRIYGATSSSGGTITRPGSDQPPLELRGRDFAFDPATLHVEATTGGGQHGLCFNRWGDRFVCSNSDHLQAIVFEERYLARNPHQSVAAPRRSIAADGPQAAVFRISPVEEWRIARTNMRVAGLAPGPIEGGGQPAGYFTGATGVTIDEGGLGSSGECAWAIVADVGSNLIHRKRLTRDGVTYRGERVDRQSEFVRSSDIWFRPVQFAIGPEGALYLADMYREVIEHPASLPPELKRQLDLASGRDRGRIYRIVPADYTPSPPATLDRTDTVGLVRSLDSANLWRRMTALRLLYESQDSSAVLQLRALVVQCPRAEGRIAALYALEGLHALLPADLIRALHDSHCQVRRHALRLAEPFLDAAPELLRRVRELAVVDDPTVQFQLALTLGESRDPQVAADLAAIISRNVDDSDIQNAALTSSRRRAGPVLRTLVGDDSWLQSPNAMSVIESLVRQIVAEQREEDIGALNVALSISDGGSGDRGRQAILRTLGRLPAATFRQGDSAVLKELEKTRAAGVANLIHQARLVLGRDDATLADRLAVIDDLGFDTFANQQALFEKLLSPQEPAAIHAAVFTACASFDAPDVADTVLAHWGEYTPAERTAATQLLLRRKAWTLALVTHLSGDDVPLATLDPTHVAQLVNHPLAEVRNAARALRGQADVDRRRVFQDYRAAMPGRGDPLAGRSVFEKNCSTCHALAGAGHAVGPNLAAMASRGRDALLLNILAPNAEVDPRFLEYMVLTADGQYVTGVIAGESATAVTLRGPDNKTTTVLRVDIDEMHNTGKSLMPDGFEKLVDQRSMADLLAFLEQAAATGEESP